MAPPSLWSGNLRLSLVLIPVRLIPAVSTEEAISFRQIHEPSGTPIKYVKGVRDGDTFTEVPEEEIVKGYEHAKGHHVLIHPKEIEELKLEAKHTIDMVRFVDEDEIDTRYFEKPYYLIPDGDEADEGYAVIRDALKATSKIAIGQLIMQGREHLVGIKPLGRGLMLSILRYANDKGEARIGTWLARIVINEALGWLRRRRPTTVTSLSSTDIGLDAQIIPFPGANRIADPETTMAQSETHILLERAIDGLPEGFREVFVARLVEGMSVEETAELFGIPPQTVKTRLFRARALLRTEIERQIGPVLRDAFPFAGRRCEQAHRGRAEPAAPSLIFSGTF